MQGGKMTSNPEKLKDRHAAVVRALHGECRRYPGGIVQVAKLLGVNAQRLTNQLNPNNIHDQPSMCDVLDIIEAIRAVGAVRAIAASVEMDVVDDYASPALSSQDGFRRVVKEFGDVLTEGALDLSDGRFDASERLRMIAELDQAITSAQALRAFLASAG